MDVWRMRAQLDGDALRPPRWPAGVSARTFTPADAEALHALLVHGYRHGGGSVAAFETWLPEMTGDVEFDAHLWFLAESDQGLAGAVLCWTSAFVKDLVVHESWRRHGLGEALLRQAFAAFAARGATRVDLKVQATNAGASRLYEPVGMHVIESAG